MQLRRRINLRWARAVTWSAIVKLGGRFGSQSTAYDMATIPGRPTIWPRCQRRSPFRALRRHRRSEIVAVVSGLRIEPGRRDDHQPHRRRGQTSSSGTAL
jgi:hypothetical protein